MEADDLLPDLYQRVREVVADWESRIQHTLQKGVKKGEIRADVQPEAFAVFFIGTIEGGILMARLKDEVEPFDLLTDPLRERIAALRTS